MTSMVPPDLLATMNRVFLRAILPAAAAMAPGSVVSSTWSFKWPGAVPKVCLRTSGHRLEPPMPSNTASFNPAFLISFTNALISGTASAMNPGKSSQPSRCRIVP
jgi:hypothetical protein